MAFKFFNIGKANEEITRLEGEVARLTNEAQVARDNAESVSAAAEGIKSDLAAAQLKITELETKASELSAANDSIKKLEKERDDLKAIIEKPDGEIEKRASAKALEITASQGVKAPIGIKPETKNEAPKTWTEKAQAALKKI